MSKTKLVALLMACGILGCNPASAPPGGALLPAPPNAAARPANSQPPGEQDHAPPDTRAALKAKLLEAARARNEEVAKNILEMDELRQCPTLREARNRFQTQLTRKVAENQPAEKPPQELFQLIRYPGPLGSMAAYLTPDPNDNQKHPAIIWIVGGDCNSIGGVWEEAPADNEQTASAYRKAGIVMMFPSLRGGNDSAGHKEAFYGEVDDILAAAAHLAKQPYVDPQRIYLGGHSTGGTLALLVAECSRDFRAVFSFGPVENIAGYGLIGLPVNLFREAEQFVRSPGPWLKSIQTPTFVFEGTEESNHGELLSLSGATNNPAIQFFEVKGANHFNVLAPTNALIAKRILLDRGATCNLSFTAPELSRPFAPQ